MGLNDPQWGRKKGNSGPPDLEELWLNFNKKLNNIFGRKRPNNGQSGGEEGPGNSNFKRYMGGMGAGLFAGLIFLLWLASGFYIVNEGQRGLILRFGQYTQTTQAGLRWHFPYPIETVENVNVSQVRTVEIGYRNNVKSKVLKESLMLTDDENIIEADAVIISTGASAKWLGIPSEEKFNGFGVSACAVCDGFFFKGKEVAIVGAGDTAAEEALYLSKMCTTVHMIVRKDQMRASKVMQDRVLNTPNIKMYFNCETDEILGEKTVQAVRIKNTKTNTLQEIPVSAFFVAIGHNPNSSIFSEFIHTDETGYILTEPGTTKTNVPGVFASGDVQDKNYRQAVTAAGSGCMAALDAERYLTANGH